MDHADLALLAARPGPLTVAAAFPATVIGAGTFAGTVVVTARERVAGTTTPEAGVYVARDGTVVATPLPQDLVAVAVDVPAGGTLELPARAPADLPPGRYDLYAVVTVTDDARTPLAAAGGPWPLDVTAP